MQTVQPEMLWESSDPARVLRERFALADAGAARQWVGEVLREHWAIDVRGLTRLVMSDCNALAFVQTDRGELVAKWCVDPSRFEARRVQAELVARLARAGMPVSGQLPAVSGQVQPLVDGCSMGVQRQLPGTLLDVQDLAVVREVGAALARLHGALATTPATGLGPGPVPLRERIAAWLDAGHAPTDLAAALRSRLAALPDPPRRPQAVHGDVRAANILIRDGRVVAFLDFEEARLDEPLVELARTEVLLATRFRDWRPTTAAARQALRDGYESVRGLEPDEQAWHDAVLAWQAMAVAATQTDPSWWQLARELSA